MKPSTADPLWSLAITLAIVGLYMLGQPTDTPLPNTLDVATLQFALLACVKLDRLLKGAS